MARIRSRSRGFTLIELMITVAIIGILAILAAVGYAKFIRAAKTSEATQMLAAIKTGQETYRAETLRYMDASAGSLDTYFPAASPATGKVAWDTTSCTADPCKGFKTLNVKAEGPVQYRYSTIAGNADGAVRTIDGHKYPAATDPWYVVKARGDTNGNGIDALFWTSSWDNYVWCNNTALKGDCDE